MDTLKIQCGNASEFEAYVDGPGYMMFRQDDQEISINLVQAIALAEFITANRGAMVAAYKEHCKGRSHGNGG